MSQMGQLGPPPAAISPVASAAMASDPFAFAVAPAPALAVPIPAAPAPVPGYTMSAFSNVGGFGGDGDGSGGGSRTYTVVIPKSAQGFGIKLNDTPTGDAFVEGFTHQGPQQAVRFHSRVSIASDSKR